MAASRSRPGIPAPEASIPAGTQAYLLLRLMWTFGAPAPNRLAAIEVMSCAVREQGTYERGYDMCESSNPFPVGLEIGPGASA